MNDGAIVIRGDTRHIPLPDHSVDLIVTSPPYYGQRSYKDGDEHFPGQLGDEATPQEWLAELWAATSEWARVLKPSGSAWVNLGDKRSGSGAPGTTSGLSTSGSTLQGTTQQNRGGRESMLAARQRVQGERSGMRGGYSRAAFGRAKSKQLLPHRYAIGCEDGAAEPIVDPGEGWIVRQDQVWWKKNGMPESVSDRMRDQHEYLFHLTRQGDYYAAIDELREPHKPETLADPRFGREGVTGSNLGASGNGKRGWKTTGGNPLGAAPGSVWHLATEPLIIPEWLSVEHFAAFPTEIPRRLILGFSPPGICLECGEGRRPATDVEHELTREALTTGRARTNDLSDAEGNGWNGEGYPKTRTTSTIIGYVCACTPFTDHEDRRRPSVTPGRERINDNDARAEMNETRRHGDDFPQRLPVREWHLDRWTPAPTRPAVVLDPFGGTGTTALVARALGRLGVSVDLSWDYSRVAFWRVFQSGHGAKAVERTNRERQGTLL